MVNPSPNPSNPSPPTTISKKKKKRTPKKKVVKPLPKVIRDKIPMCCALRAFSKLKCGNAKRLKDQYNDMSTFYHGKKPNQPSQIALLCNASYSYRALFDTTMSVATKKSDDMDSISTSILKKSLTRDNHRDYHSGTDISSLDLEKKKNELHLN